MKESQTMTPNHGPVWPRRRLLQASLLAGGALSLAPAGARGRTTDTVRLTWGYGGLTLVAKERGVFAPELAKQGIKVEWLGPFPNHAPTLQAVTGGSADFSFGGSTTPALAALIAGAPPRNASTAGHGLRPAERDFEVDVPLSLRSSSVGTTSSPRALPRKPRPRAPGFLPFCLVYWRAGDSPSCRYSNRQLCRLPRLTESIR